MFTGLIEEIGFLKTVRPTGAGLSLEVEASTVLQDLKTGDSIALNGICLTVTRLLEKGFAVQAVTETVENSTIRFWKSGQPLNLERAAALGDRLGGHLVQGHIDGMGIVKSIQTGELQNRIIIKAEPDVMRYIVRKGSIAVDGVSLTVASTEDDSFSVALIPFTWDNTIFKYIKSGDRVNLETDIIARYVEKFIILKTNSQSLNENFLRQAGF